MAAKTYTPGKLVNLRGRDWVVMPSDDPDLLMVKPLNGTEEETTGIYLPLAFQNEEVKETSFPPPSGKELGSLSSARLLLNAARLSFRNATGPFRCIGRLSFRPRAYQMVPLIMALKQELTRLLIADDVGVGKTVEALLIVKELLERREINRFAIVCPPHLCEQWQKELKDKFDINAVIIRSNTQASLDRKVHGDESVFSYYPYQVISVDYIKGERLRQIFVNECPEMIVVDEAHTCTRPAGVGSGTQHQRYSLIRKIADKPNQHLVLLTATPHSGKKEQFQSLLGLIDTEFEAIDLATAGYEQRKKVAQHFIQRKRGDVAQWMGEDTQFPKRVSNELDYDLSADFRAFFFDELLPFTQELVKDNQALGKKQRVHFWTALALLRGVMSSPAAGIQMLQNRLEKLPVSEEEISGDNPVYDHSEAGFENDNTPSHLVQQTEWNQRQKQQLKSFIQSLEGFKNPNVDRKLLGAQAVLEDWLSQGVHPVIFCRYIETAKYLGEQLKALLSKKYPKLELEVITSEDPDEVRKERIEAMQSDTLRVLVATDCLSEGINLQHRFNAVMHYDLPWNPNRLEQREGRVDRFGQQANEVYTMLLYGKDNPIDGTVFRVILDKVREIKRSTGYSVPFPEDSETVMDTILNAVLLNPSAAQQYNSAPAPQLALDLGMEQVDKANLRIQSQLAEVQQREKASRDIFAQHAIKAQEVENDLKEADAAVGSPEIVEAFIVQAMREIFGVQVDEAKEGWRLQPANLPDILKRKLLPEGQKANKPLKLSFYAPEPDGYTYLGRNHPFVEQCAQILLGHTLIENSRYQASRASVIRTKQVDRVHSLMLLRVRNVIQSKKRKNRIVAEEIMAWGFKGDVSNPTLITSDKVMELLEKATASSDLAPERQERLLSEFVSSLPVLDDLLESEAEKRSQKLTEAHERYRRFMGSSSSFEVVYPVQPMDVLGVYILLPEIN